MIWFLGCLVWAVVWMFPMINSEAASNSVCTRIRQDVASSCGLLGAVGDACVFTYGLLPLCCLLAKVDYVAEV